MLRENKYKKGDLVQHITNKSTWVVIGHYTSAEDKFGIVICRMVTGVGVTQALFDPLELRLYVEKN